MIDGLIVSDSDSEYHVFRTKLEEVPAELKAIGIGYYKDTYQSFNVMILMRLAKMDPSVRYDVCEEFPLMFNATKDIGGGRYAGRKVVAAELGEELCGGTYAGFIADEFAKLPTDIASIETAIGNMMISAVVTPKPQPKK